MMAGYIIFISDELSKYIKEYRENGSAVKIIRIFIRI